MDFQSVYSLLPPTAQNIVCSVWGVKERRLSYGGKFQEMLSWLSSTQWWDSDKIRTYQSEQLSKLLTSAYKHVPYYRALFDTMGIKPSDVSSVSHLKSLPCLTKDLVRANEARLISDKADRHRLVEEHTSGTSGKSLHFYLEPEAIQFQWAVWWRHKLRFGVTFDSRYATFTGKCAVPLTRSVAPYWRENRAMHQTIFTMHHMTPLKVREIVGRLNDGGFEYYSGYPSIISALARLIQEAGLQVTSPPKVIFTGAETLYENQRRLIADVFGCTVTDQYGFSEGCANASRCECDMFHEDFEFGILECEEPERIDDVLYRGRILATGFASSAMPFVRYDVGDVGLWRNQQCTCGRASRILVAIEGRCEDYVLTPEGTRIMRFDYIFKDTRNVKEAQVVQTESGKISLRIVREPTFSARDEAYLRAQVRSKVSPTLGVDFEYVDEIPREPGGKFRAVQSRVQCRT